MPRIDISSLSPQKQLELADKLLGGLEGIGVPLSESIRAELDRRNATFPETYRHAAPWAKVRARLRQKNR